MEELSKETRQGVPGVRRGLPQGLESVPSTRATDRVSLRHLAHASTPQRLVRGSGSAV